jgi:hypothetical protein
MTTPPDLAARIGDLVRRLLSLRPAARAPTKAGRRRTARTATRGLWAALGIRAAAGSARPVKVLVLSLATLAAGGLGLMVAYAATPDDGLATQVLVTNGETYTVATITGPEGTRTVAITKTKTGKTKYIPVRITSTVDGPGDTEEVFVEVAGESVVLTETETNILAQIIKQIETETQVVTQPVTQTDVVTTVVTQPVTVTETVNHTETFVDIRTVTETVTVTETETVTTTVTEPPLIP